MSFNHLQANLKSSQNKINFKRFKLPENIENEQTRERKNVWIRKKLPTPLVVSSSYDKTLKVWDINAEKCVKTLVGHENYVTSIICLSSGIIVSASWDLNLKFWDIRQKTNKSFRTIPGHLDWIDCLTVFKEGFASASVDQCIKVWDKFGNLQKTFRGHTNDVKSLLELPTGELVSCSWDCTLRIWTNEGKCIRTLKEEHSQTFFEKKRFTLGIYCILLINQHLLAGSDDKNIKCFHLESANFIKNLQGHGDSVLCLSLLTDRLFASGSGDKKIKIWDFSMSRCIKTLSGHSSWITCMIVLPSGECLSGSNDKSIKLWNINTGKCVKTLKGHESAVSGLTFDH